MSDSRLVQDVFPCEQQMAIIERYEDFANYAYPIALNIPRQHTVLREMFLKDVLAQSRLFFEAGKSSQISKLFAADAGLASLRFHLRFMAHSSRKLITKRQHSVASAHLAEVGKMTGAWIRSMKSKG